MTEEQVTKALLKWLINNNWQIVCFDFPQSGTGIILHHDDRSSEKNKDSIIPDIIAVRNGYGLYFENKDRFYLPDYKKINKLRTNNQYLNSMSLLLDKYNIISIFYGIGIPSKKHNKQSINSASLVDFIAGVNQDYSVELVYSGSNLQAANII